MEVAASAATNDDEDDEESDNDDDKDSGDGVEALDKELCGIPRPVTTGGAAWPPALPPTPPPPRPSRRGERERAGVGAELMLGDTGCACPRPRGRRWELRHQAPWGWRRERWRGHPPSPRQSGLAVTV